MKRALLMSPPFFGYHEHIMAGLRARGYAVDYFNDKPTENGLVKGAIRVRPSLIKGVVRHYLEDILKDTAEVEYDLILVINGKVATAPFVSELRRRNPQAEAVLYLWDSVPNYPNVLEYSGLFDRRYTFDPVDSRDHAFELLPLFYTNGYAEVGQTVPVDVDWDIVNVCTAHINRYELMRELVPALERQGLNVYSYLYLNPLMYAYYRLTSPVFKEARRSEFNFSPLPTTSYIDVLSKSRAVLDVNHSGQTGLTMRTIETIGARRKLITTNQEVLHAAFYDPTRIMVFDAQTTPEEIKEFLVTPMADPDDAVIESYSIDSWLDRLVGESAAS